MDLSNGQKQRIVNVPNIVYFAAMNCDLVSNNSSQEYESLGGDSVQDEGSILHRYRLPCTLPLLPGIALYFI